MSPATSRASGFTRDLATTGTHVGHLWDAAGDLLATATFSGETASGWQQVNFATPVADRGKHDVRGIVLRARWATTRSTAAPCTSGMQRRVCTPCRMDHREATESTCLRLDRWIPNNSFNASNYWVDVVFSNVLPINAPTRDEREPGSGATGVAIGTTVTATFSEPVQSGHHLVYPEGPQQQCRADHARATTMTRTWRR